MTQISAVESVLEVPFRGLAYLGAPHIVSDVESTLAPYGVAEVDPAILSHINKYRDLGYIASFSLFTNKTNVDFVGTIAEQLGGVPYFMPEDKSQRKPSPFLLERAMEATGSHPEETVVIGDKLTADIYAARRAGAFAAFWVKRLGSSDHFGDRILRRPYEAIRRPYYSYHTKRRP